MSSKTKEKKRVLKPKSFGKKKVAKKKDPTKSKAAQALAKNKANAITKKDSKTPGALYDKLLLERKYTDEEIFAQVKKAFPENKKITQSYCNNHRWALNKIPTYAPNCDAKKNPVERLFKKDGKLIPKSKMPKPERKTKKKYTEENDPLKKVAGINVHDKATKKAIPKKKILKKKGKPESTS